jgi:microcystin-dependent protein
MANYNTIKTMKHSQIGTIMAWAGDANTGFLPSNIPTGWILCDGKTYSASRYPLLASIIGITYGGNNDLSFDGSFPEYKNSITNVSDTFKVPDLTARVMMDMKSDYLADVRYNSGQSDSFSKVGSLFSRTGAETPINSIISKDTDLKFNINGNTYIGKLTMNSGSSVVQNTLNPAAYQTTAYIVPRKLGQNHMPGHVHRATGNDYLSATTGGGGVKVFWPTNVTTGGSVSTPDGQSHSFTQIFLADVANNTPWTSGAAPITYYDPNTLITTDKFYDFPNNMNTIPGAGHNYLNTGTLDANPPPLSVQSSASGRTNSITGVAPSTGHVEPAWSGSFPIPATVFNKKNYFGNINPNDYTAISASATASSGSISLTLAAGTNFTNIKSKMFVYTTPSAGTFGGLASGTMVVDVNPVSRVIVISKPTTASLSSTTIYFKQGTWPTTLNNVVGSEDPSSTSFQSHNHGNVDIQMNSGSLRPQSTFSIDNISLGDVAPVDFPKALNVTANVACPALNIVYIIRAY